VRNNIRILLDVGGLFFIIYDTTSHLVSCTYQCIEIEDFYICLSGELDALPVIQELDLCLWYMSSDHVHERADQKVRGIRTGDYEFSQ